MIGKLNEAISHRTSAARTVHAIFAQHLLHKSISSRHGDANFFKPFIVNVEGKVPHIKPKVKMKKHFVLTKKQTNAVSGLLLVRQTRSNLRKKFPVIK